VTMTVGVGTMYEGRYSVCFYWYKLLRWREG
jgi:hypothetical protein